MVIETITETKSGLMGNLYTAQSCMEAVSHQLERLWEQGDVRMKKGEVARLKKTIKAISQQVSPIRGVLKEFDKIALPNKLTPTDGK